MSNSTTTSGAVAPCACGIFGAESLELNWRFAYPQQIIPLLLTYLGVQNGMHILDAGCGTGFLSRLLANALDDVQVTGVDVDTALLAAGRTILSHEGLDARVVLQEADVRQLPFPDHSFDLVTSHTLL